MAILQANGIGNTPAFEFVKQDTKTLFKGLSGLSKVANVLTSAGAKVNEITQGAGMGSSKVAPIIDLKDEEKLNTFKNIFEYVYPDKQDEMNSYIEKNNFTKKQNDQMLSKLKTKMMEDNPELKDAPIMEKAKETAKETAKVIKKQVSGLLENVSGRGEMKISRPNTKLKMKGEGSSMSRVSPIFVEIPPNETPQMKEIRIQMEKKLKLFRKMDRKTTSLIDMLGGTDSAIMRQERQEQLRDEILDLAEQYDILLEQINPDEPTETESPPSSEGSGMKRKFAKGSQEAKDFMKSLRDKRKN